MEAVSVGDRVRHRSGVLGTVKAIVYQGETSFGPEYAIGVVWDEWVLGASNKWWKVTVEREVEVVKRSEEE